MAAVKQVGVYRSKAPLLSIVLSTRLPGMSIHEVFGPGYFQVFPSPTGRSSALIYSDSDNESHWRYIASGEDLLMVMAANTRLFDILVSETMLKQILPHLWRLFDKLLEVKRYYLHNLVYWSTQINTVGLLLYFMREHLLNPIAIARLDRMATLDTRDNAEVVFGGADFGDGWLGPLPAYAFLNSLSPDDLRDDFFIA